MKHGGHIELSETWAMSLLKRMGHDTFVSTEIVKTVSHKELFNELGLYRCPENGMYSVEFQ